jgi:rhodanese-related sulfurtransferase
MSVPEIRVEELKQRLDAGENLFLLDVRDEFEYEISNIGGQLIPLSELPKRMNELDTNLNIVTICKMGARGAKAAQVLHKAGLHSCLESDRRNSRLVGSRGPERPEVLEIRSSGFLDLS